MVAEYAGDDAEARTVLASILDDQFLLARAVLDLDLTDLDARQAWPAPARHPRAAVASSRPRPAIARPLVPGTADLGDTPAVRAVLCRELIGRDEVLESARAALSDARRGPGRGSFS